jgi:hypothetical protein
LTSPASWIAPPNSSNFSVRRVLAGVRMRDDRKRPPGFPSVQALQDAIRAFCEVP